MLARFLPILMLFALALANAKKPPASVPSQDGRRLEVLFLGSENLFNHDPVARFRVIRKALGPAGINFTYTDTTSSLSDENLARYDVLLIFANQYTIEDGEKAALLKFAREGGGCVLLHCAAGCFRKSDFPEYVDLLGAKFKSHKSGVFRAKIVEPEHEIMQGWEGFECWDETYVHQQHAEYRTILQRREDEPWTWVKTYGKGRVFYTASGHDHRCWDLPQYHELIRRAIRWTAGKKKSALLDSLELPKLAYRQAAVPKDPDNPVGPNNQLQLPLEPEESLKLAQIPVGFELRLFAAEPDIVNPIAIRWDDRGRLWAVEAFDYPNKVASDQPQDRIKILEDTDRDGSVDKVTIFAEGLNICTSVLPVAGGAIATDGADMVFLPDADGDDRADGKKVIFTGLGQRDTHACTSNLRHGPGDGWIYATVGYSGLDVTLAGERHQSEMGVFRFKQDGSAFEVLQNTSNNTWGLGFTEEGDLVGSTANGNPSWYLSIPNRYFEAAGMKPRRVPKADKNPTIYPITSDYFQNNPKEKVSSGAGHAIYTARRFPADWWNRRALICEPPLHLVVAPTFENDGTMFKASGFEQNLYASADAWSAPVAAEVGPDGAVWIADWYNPICNHNPYRKHHKRGRGNGFVTSDRDREHGRIYRIFPTASAEPEYPDLDSAALNHDNLFWRLAAERKLEQQADVPELDRTTSTDRRVAAAALDRLPREPASAETALRILLNPKRHPMLRKKAALFLTELPPDRRVGEMCAVVLFQEKTISGDLRTAIGLAGLRHRDGFLRLAIDLNIAADGLEPILKAAGRDLPTDLLVLARSSQTRIGQLISGRENQPTPAKKVPAGGSLGSKIYGYCSACHLPDGGGIENLYPALDQSPWVVGDEEALIKIVLKGIQGSKAPNGKPYPTLMPSVEDIFSEEEIAAVLTYVRSAWSNDASEIKPERVAEIRKAITSRKKPYHPSELDADK